LVNNREIAETQLNESKTPRNRGCEYQTRTFQERAAKGILKLGNGI
jgi:hypothetical protein